MFEASVNLTDLLIIIFLCISWGVIFYQTNGLKYYIKRKLKHIESKKHKNSSRKHHRRNAVQHVVIDVEPTSESKKLT